MVTKVTFNPETGYGDPLRIKVIPDFSLRFVDEEFTAENDVITKIQVCSPCMS
jgi:hypothetical protein